MGDLVQALPALSDAAAIYPNLIFDWVADESFAEIPAWHPAVGQVFPIPLRRWKSVSRQAVLRGILLSWRKDIKEQRYDAVIDLQGNFKSAALARGASGERHGYDGTSIREWGAHFAYNRRHAVAKNQHAILRMRKLMSRSLNYPLSESEPNFALDPLSWPDCDIDLPAKPFLVFVTNASWPTKSWPQESWKSLVSLADDLDYQILLPWGSEAEHRQVQQIAVGYKNAFVLPRLNLGSLAGLMLRSAGTVSVDTGLAHISAALGRPTVTLYGPTDPRLIGASGPQSDHLAAKTYACIPCYRKLCKVDDYQGAEARCLSELPVAQVWQALQSAIGRSETHLNLVSG